MSSFVRKLGYFTRESGVSGLSLPPGSDLATRHSYLHSKKHWAQTDSKIISVPLESASSESANRICCSHAICGVYEKM